MGKISPVSAKYIVHANIEIEGIVDRPDVIGAIFGQTEGLLGSDLELRELQRSGRIGRIEVNADTKGGKTRGAIIIPSSLDKAETAIVGAALEVIERIGPCNAKIKVDKIEDVRISKRSLVIERAKELLKSLMDNSMPDSQELADEVAYSVRVMEVQEYGKDRLPAGPAIDESDEVIIVEGRADVINLLKHGIKNSIAMNGTSVPQTIIDLSKKKIITVFVDGDRGGSLIIKELLEVAEIDNVTRAPDGKEVEEITKKEIHKALRSKISPEQFKAEFEKSPLPQKVNFSGSRPQQHSSQYQNQQSNHQMQGQQSQSVPQQRPVSSVQSQQAQPPRIEKKQKLSEEEKKSFSGMLEDLIGTRGAYILDYKRNILGKVPISELASTLKSLNTGVYAIILDGTIDRDLVKVAENTSTKFVIAMDSKIKSNETRLEIVTSSDL